MTDHEIRYFGGLIEGGFKEEKETRYRVRLNPEMARVFRGDLWASLDIQQRRDLKRSQTAKALKAQRRRPPRERTGCETTQRLKTVSKKGGDATATTGTDRL